MSCVVTFAFCVVCKHHVVAASAMYISNCSHIAAVLIDGCKFREDEKKRLSESLSLIYSWQINKQLTCGYTSRVVPLKQ